MELKRRFIFNGHASALGGRVVRSGEAKQGRSVKDGFIDVPAAALGPAGGRSSAIIPGGQAGEFVQYAGGTTTAEGVFDDVKGHFELTQGRGQEDALTTTTRVQAELRELAIGLRPQLTIERLRASLISRSPRGSFETPVQIGDGTAIDGVAIDGKFKLRIDLNIKPFCDHPTLSTILAAADDPTFVRRHGGTLFMNTTFDSMPAPPASGRLIKGLGGYYVHATIVKSIRWAGNPYPGARIDGNTVTIPGIGRLFFGELLLKPGERRLTMLRATLGSPVKQEAPARKARAAKMGGSEPEAPVMGFMCAVDVQDNGSWSI